ncbi:hypothetical protein GCM10010403_08770 [Glycomyces rutgersensis]|uniref:Uncharacterized protein n=1 Tax=Glycomyces rutgersensis TaxID=58115 RepID=A0ABN3F836_9ACTN
MCRFPAFGRPKPGIPADNRLPAVIGEQDCKRYRAQGDIGSSRPLCAKGKDGKHIVSGAKGDTPDVRKGHSLGGIGPRAGRDHRALLTSAWSPDPAAATHGRRNGRRGRT